MKRGNSDFPRFAIQSYCPFSTKTKSVSLTLFQSNEHLQNTLFTKLPDQFIEVHNIFKPLKAFI